MAFLQKKKENLRKRSRVTATVLCILLLMFTGARCGKVEEPIPVDLSSGNMEELRNDTTGENRDGSEEAAVRDAETDPEDVSAGMTKVDADDDMNESEKNGSKNHATRTDSERDTNEDNEARTGQDDSPDENVQQSEEAQSHSVGNAELEGNVRSIGVDSFVAARAETWSEGDAQYMTASAPGYENEEDLITVHVDQNCVWEFKTVKNGGINPEDVSTREGSFTDLKEGIAINSKGSWQDDGSFLADSIVMMIFV